MSPAIVFDMSSANSGSVLSVPHLKDNGSNWVDYEVKAKMALGLKGLHRHIEGTTMAPIPFALENDIPMSRPGIPATKDKIEMKEKKINDYEQKEYLAQHIVQSTVSPHVAALIHSKTASKMWRIVKADATDKSKMRKVETHQKLQEMHCDEGTNIQVHLNGMIHAWDELVAMGSILSDPDFTSMILASMPDSFHLLLSSVTQAGHAAGKTTNPNDLI